MIELRRVTKTFRAHGRDVRAVEAADLEVGEGEIVGLVGESGSGKSTLGRMLAGLLEPDTGGVFFEKKPLAGMGRAARRDFRRAVQVVFQNPLHSLNPRMTAGQILAEPFEIHGGGSGAAAGSGRRPRGAAEELLEKVGLPTAYAKRFPYELSGGERQRVSIARAIALKPRLVVLDEAVSSLDVLVRAGILNLLLDLHLKEKVAYLFISHDLRVVRHLCDRVAVMHGGRIVETGPARQVLDQPMHDYTRTFIEASGL